MRTRKIEILPIFALLFALWGAGSGRAEEAGGPPVPVLSGCEPDYPPYCFHAGNGQVDGFSVELFRAALQSAGREVEFKAAPWAELKQDLAEGRLQALPLMGRTPEREALYDFTIPYLTMHGTLVVREDDKTIRGLADLKGRQVAVMAGDNAEEYLRRVDPGAKIVARPSFEIALRELSQGKHDAVVVQKLVFCQLAQKTGLDNLRAVGPQLFSQNFCFAVREGDRALLDTLNEGLSLAMADGTFRRLHAKWFAGIEAAGRGKSRIVIGGDRDFPPYEFLDANGQPAGFNVDLTRAIARRMNLPVEIRLDTWSQVRKGLEAGEIDAIQTLFYSPERDRSFDFAPPSTLVQYAIFVRAGSPEPAGLAELAGRAVLVMESDIMHDLALENGLANIVAVPTQEEALRRLAAGEGDCALAAKIPALYWIEKNGWTALKAVGRPVLSAEACYASPQGKDELLAQLSEGLAALKTTDEYRQIRSKWLGPYEVPRLGFRKMLQIVLGAVLPLLALLAASVLWSRSLRRRVDRRTQELQQRTKELQKSNASLDLIIENIPNMLFLKDARDLRFVRFNQAGEELLGHSRIELLGKSDFDFFPKEQAEFFTLKDREVLAGKTAVDIAEEPLQTPHGVRFLHTRKVPVLNAQGEPEYLLGISEDITARKQAEEEREKLRAQLVQAHKMESVGRLAGGVAHDFNNMLQAILGHAELALEQTTPDQPIRGDLLEIQKAATRSADLTRQLLAFARKQTVAPRILDLNETVEGMLKMLRRLIGENIELVWRPGAPLWPVKVDSSQIDQILANLCVNARDAIADRGQVIIETGTETFDEADAARHPEHVPGDYVRLSVGDTGCGMSKETQSKLFEPFFTTKGLGQGTGLGLATVYGAVKQNNGFIHVDSEPGEGTTFRIYLPRHKVPPAPGANPAVPAQTHVAGGLETVLLVEDTPAILETTRAMLEKLGYQILAAFTPGDALRLAKAYFGKIHLLITDVVMPGMDGPELAENLQPLCPDIKRLFMSGYTANILSRHGVTDKGMHFLQKPFTMQDLAAKAREALGTG